ncbi:transposase [Candidatus Protochlamydia sp. W-9]|uniref:transposase n=1 Tax=Candidatus Protochlamydia sp. W-9 TaxID=1785087 RepID=UPI000AA1F77B|nr:transposase [Candidatus Protochlamydia sp. W-9]
MPASNVPFPIVSLKSHAKWGKTTIGWFFGVKLHLVINHHAKIVVFKLTTGKLDDRKPVSEMVEGMKGKAFADRGDMSEKLTQTLMQKGMHLFTKVKKMKNQWITLVDKLMLKKRAMIENVNHLLKIAVR